MPKSLDKHKKVFMDPHNLGQLADDITIYADNFESLKLKFIDLLTYSKEKGQVANINKTVYIHFSDSPNITPILINSHD